MKRNLKNNGFEVRGTNYEVRGTGIWHFVIRTSRLVLLTASLALAACTGKDTVHEHATYTCPMHPTVISDRPGTCPVCGMNLVSKARAGEEFEITEDLAKLIKSPNEIVIASIKTVKGQYKSMPVSVEAQGVVTYDTRNIYTISSRVGGRLEKVYLKYVFQLVSKGQKIAEIYSPELLTAQRELLFLLENDVENESLIDAAKNKLELLGFSTSQINNLIQRKEASNIITIYSPYSGYAITNQQTPSTSISMVSSTSGSINNGMSDGMGASSLPSATTTSPIESAPTSSLPREGNYISAGGTLASVVNTDALRVELDLPASRGSAIKNGDKLKLNFGIGNEEEALVDFVQPFFNESQNFVKIRVAVKNSKDLHIGHLVNATIMLAQSEALWVPQESVLDLGTDKIVFVKEHGVLKPKKVTTGISSEGLIEIKSGLSSSEEIAANAQYLIDSESFIKTIK